MIAENKLKAVLHAIQDLIIEGRRFAFEKKDSKVMFDYLDSIEFNFSSMSKSVKLLHN